MIIILEGIDKSGKTTLSKEISKKTKYTYIKFPSEEIRYLILNKKIKTTEKIEILIKEMESFLKNIDIKKHYIIDRWWISTLVYQGYNEYYKDLIMEKLGKYLLNKKLNYLFYIKSNLEINKDNEDIYEEQRENYLNKYEDLFCKKSISFFYNYFDEVHIIYNEKGKFNETLNKIFLILNKKN